MKCVDAAGSPVWCSSIDAVVPDEEAELKAAEEELAKVEAEEEEAEAAALPTTTDELTEAIDNDIFFGKIDVPEQKLRTPAYKALKNAGGPDFTATAYKKKPLQDGWHILQVIVARDWD